MQRQPVGNTGNVHLIAGDADLVPKVLALLEQEGMPARGNPDLYVRSYKHFGIDEARELRERASLKAIGERRIFVLAMPGMTSEAQNALLKTLEESPGGAHFFFIVPAPETLLPTFRSRAEVVDVAATSSASGGQSPHIRIVQFLSASPQKRLAMLAPLLEKDEDERRDLGAILTFLSSLERIAGERVAEAGGREGLMAIYRARHYATDKGSLLKTLLEQVALLVPKV